MMNFKCRTILVLSGVLALSAGVAQAQQAPPPPPPDAMMHDGPGGEWMAPPMGERIELLGFEGMHGGKVVTGAPFSAVGVSETTQTLADGNRIMRTTKTNLFRDSQGRFRKEITLSGFGPLATSGQPKSFVVLNDPVAGAGFVLHPDTKVAEKMGGHGARGAGKGLKNGAASGAISDRMAAHEQKLIAEGVLKKEDLGAQTVAGVLAQGTRITRTIPAGQMGNEKPINIVSERWYSSELQMVVMSTRTDPRSGTTTYTLTNIQRSEPNAALFNVPADYTVTQGRSDRHGNLMYKREPLPPPNN